MWWCCEIPELRCHYLVAFFSHFCVGRHHGSHWKRLETSYNCCCKSFWNHKLDRTLWYEILRIMQNNFHDLNYLQFTKSKICIIWLLILMIIIVDAWNLKRSFFSTAAALFCFTTLLNDNRRTKGAKSLSLHSRSKEKIIALKLATKCTFCPKIRWIVVVCSFLFLGGENLICLQDY